MFKKLVYVSVILVGCGVLWAQDNPSAIPTAPFDKLPGVVEVILGAIAAVVTEFVQKQKSSWVSLGIAVGLSLVGGVVSTLVHGVPVDNLPVFVVQIWAMATATWSVLFKATGLSKKLGTS